VSLSSLKTVIRCADFERSQDFYARILGQRWIQLRATDGLLSALYEERG